MKVAYVDDVIELLPPKPAAKPEPQPKIPAFKPKDIRALPASAASDDLSLDGRSSSQRTNQADSSFKHTPKKPKRKRPKFSTPAEKKQGPYKSKELISSSSDSEAANTSSSTSSTSTIAAISRCLTKKQSSQW